MELHQENGRDVPWHQRAMSGEAAKFAPKIVIMHKTFDSTQQVPAVAKDYIFRLN